MMDLIAYPTVADLEQGTNGRKVNQVAITTEAQLATLFREPRVENSTEYFAYCFGHVRIFEFNIALAMLP